VWIAQVDPLKLAEGAERLGVIGILVLAIFLLLYLLLEERKERRYWRDLALQRRSMLEESLEAAETAMAMAKRRRGRLRIRRGVNPHGRQ
jgi:hypothetical protein